MDAPYPSAGGLVIFGSQHNEAITLCEFLIVSFAVIMPKSVNQFYIRSTHEPAAYPIAGPRVD
jgi:hypothetical protein